MKDDSPVTKGDLVELREHLEAWTDTFMEEIVRHLDVFAEQLRQDLIGIHSDKISLISDTIENHDVRIRRLESVTGVAA